MRSPCIGHRWRTDSCLDIPSPCLAGSNGLAPRPVKLTREPQAWRRRRWQAERSASDAPSFRIDLRVNVAGGGPFLHSARNHSACAALPLMTRILFTDFREPAAGEAYEIAYAFLARSGLVDNEYETFVFLAQFITAMVDQGHGNRILIANRAISAYRKRQSRDDLASPHDDPAGMSSAYFSHGQMLWDG